MPARAAMHSMPPSCSSSPISRSSPFPPPARLGTDELVRALLESTTRREAQGRMLTPMPRFLILPIPASKAPEDVRSSIGANAWTKTS